MLSPCERAGSFDELKVFLLTAWLWPATVTVPGAPRSAFLI